MMIFALLDLPESPVWSRSALPPQALPYNMASNIAIWNAFFLEGTSLPARRRSPSFASGQKCTTTAGADLASEREAGRLSHRRRRRSATVLRPGRHGLIRLQHIECTFCATKSRIACQIESKSRTGAKTAVQTLDPKAWLPLSIC
jgi:hypothetical protein